MTPKFWKLSQGTNSFSTEDILRTLEQRLVYIHMTTKGKAGASRPQAEDFCEAAIGDYFYLTHGNQGIYVLAQFSGPANLFSAYEGWFDRPFRFIRPSVSIESYEGPDKWWAPNHNSTFIRIPDEELQMFEEHILVPYFNLQLQDFGANAT